MAASIIQMAASIANSNVMAAEGNFEAPLVHGFAVGGGAQLTSDGAMREAIGNLMGDVADPHFRVTVATTLKEMASGAGDSAAGGAGAVDSENDGHIAASVFSALAAHTGAAGADAVANTLGLLSRLGDGAGDGGESAAATEGMSDAMISKMMSEFETMGGKEDFASVTDNMMRQLLSRDVMYIPLKSIGEGFPSWLAKHSETLTKDVYENYGKMYQCFQKLVLIYEVEPDNFPRILELFQDLQETGNPPIELIHELAPGLELGADGLPAMNANMGPGIGEMPGLPSAQCVIA